jgi:hypothetical protein
MDFENNGSIGEIAASDALVVNFNLIAETTLLSKSISHPRHLTHTDNNDMKNLMKKQ